MTYLPYSDDKTHSLSVLFVDTHVDHYHLLLKGLALDIPAHVLSPDRDGFEQICETLERYERWTSVSTVYIVAHGAPGCLYIGDGELSLSTVERYAQGLKDLFSSGAIAPKMCIYGCSVAAGDAGEEFILKLAAMTGAEITASSSLVGHSALGGTWHLDRTARETTMCDGTVESSAIGFSQSISSDFSEPSAFSEPSVFSDEVKKRWFGTLNEPADPVLSGDNTLASQESESILLVFAGQPTTLNGRPIDRKSVIQNADIIRVSEVATTFDGTVIDGVIRAVDTGIGMAYEPNKGELSCHSGSELLDGLLRVNLQFVKTATDVEVHLPNLTAQFWDTAADDEQETAEVVGFSNADSVALLGFLPEDELSEGRLSEGRLSEGGLSEGGLSSNKLEDELEESGCFNNKLSYRLRRDVAIQNTNASIDCTDSNWNKEDFQDDHTANRANADYSDSARRDSGVADCDRNSGRRYRVTAQFKQFVSTEIAYGITQSLCATAVVCGLRLNALKITRPADYEEENETESSIAKTLSHTDEADDLRRICVTTTESLSILFIDPDIQDYGRLLTNLKSGILVHALNKQEDGIEQITSVLGNHYCDRNIQSLYIAAQDAPGCLYLGNSELSAWTLDRYSHLIRTWRTDSLYLCGRYAAMEEAGSLLLSTLEALLAAPVLAIASRIEKTDWARNWKITHERKVSAISAFNNSSGDSSDDFSDDSSDGSSSRFSLNPLLSHHLPKAVSRSVPNHLSIR